MIRLGTQIAAIAVLSMGSGCAEPIKSVGDSGMSETTCYQILLTPTEAACRALVLKRCGPNGRVVGVREYTRPSYTENVGWGTQSMWSYVLQGCG